MSDPFGLMDAIIAAADRETKRQAKQFTYHVRFIDPDPEVRELTRDEVKDRLEGWVQDTELAVEILENSPGEEFRLSAFAFYWAELSTTDE